MPGDGTRFMRPPLLDFEETAKLYDPQPSQPFPDAARSKEIEAEGVFCARHSHGRRTQVGSRSVDLAMIMAMRRISASRRFLWCAWFRRWSTLEKSTWRSPSPSNVILLLITDPGLLRNGKNAHLKYVFLPQKTHIFYPLIRQARALHGRVKSNDEK